MFKTNEGGIDRIIRIIAGVVILGVVFVYPEASWRWWGLVGLIPLITGIWGFCPLYRIFGLSTCPMK